MLQAKTLKMCELCRMEYIRGKIILLWPTFVFAKSNSCFFASSKQFKVTNFYREFKVAHITKCFCKSNFDWSKQKRFAMFTILTSHLTGSENPFDVICK